MARLIGNSKISCAVFISGRGTNFKSIFNYTNKRKSKIILKLVISNKKDAHGLKFARKNKIKIKIVNFKLKNKASVPLPTPIAYFVPASLAIISSTSSTIAPNVKSLFCTTSFILFKIISLSENCSLR